MLCDMGGPTAINVHIDATAPAILLAANTFSLQSSSIEHLCTRPYDPSRRHEP